MATVVQADRDKPEVTVRVGGTGVRIAAVLDVGEDPPPETPVGTVFLRRTS